MSQQQETRWGYWIVTSEGTNWKHKLLFIKPKKKISLQYHNDRSEVWTCISGHGMIRIGSSNQMEEFDFLPEDTLKINEGDYHQIENIGDEALIISEVQYGICDENDIVRIEE